jgi:hypothetical protein
MLVLLNRHSGVKRDKYRPDSGTGKEYLDQLWGIFAQVGNSIARLYSEVMYQASSKMSDAIFDFQVTDFKIFEVNCYLIGRAIGMVTNPGRNFHATSS